MSAFLQKLDSRLPFTKSERIIIGIVLLLHALPALEFIHLSARPPKMDDDRVMANLLSPSPAKSQEAPAAPKMPAPKPKEELKKKVEEKTTPQPAPAPPKQSSAPQKQAESKSESQAQNAAVAPSSAGGVSGTPIQTDIGKLEVLYQPDADAYYPSFSKRSGEQGTVIVRLIIDQAGNVEDIALLQSSSFPRLDRAASEIGRRYRFKPFVVNGSPQRISTNLLIKFNLK
ncbi:energy transducer TonB [Polynucleobacter sp. MG-5-Ahmo-C2]|jgi:protein TonB|uniref:energy transducer TonB n=1 Tax=Polynucleobacter sp. MG-5-Ahmo-C2 TaxID=2081051 RepID=UPI001BFCFCE9|nr:energy transducer TonB [Polynucleobacter sp. MG-5-Ahmo-C2]QWD97793.1 energy transducer TonB [Polynucleobacter sp. MG-5-Ahmo-C2]